MIDQDSLKRTDGVESKKAIITEKPQENLRKIVIENKSGALNNNKLNIPRDTTLKQKSHENIHHINVLTNKDSIKGDFNFKDNYGAVDSNVDILEEVDKNTDHSYYTNKTGNRNLRFKSKERSNSKNHLKTSNSKENLSLKPLTIKKQVKFTESKESVKDNSEQNSDIIKETECEHWLSTNNDKINSGTNVQVVKPTETTAASKMTLKDIKKVDSKGSHLRTKTFSTNLVFDHREDLKKLEESKKALLPNNQMKLPPKTPKDLKSLEFKKGASLGIVNFNTTVDNTLKVPMTPKLNLLSFGKNTGVKEGKKQEPKIKPTPEVKKEVIRKVKLFVQMSQAGWNPNMKKPNQDISFICPNFADEPNNLFLAVCDGHGTYGHDVSAFLEQNLPTMVGKELKDRIKNSDVVNYTKMFEKSFQITNVKLKNDLYVDSSLSGATCVCVLYKGDKLFCANIGDSRAVIGKCVDGKWVNHDLSRDHKPTDKDEGDRIKRRGGRIEQAKKSNGDYHGPHRVWLQNENIPGIAMTRSFGDEVAGNVGVIAEPEVTEFSLSENDKFLIMATDGIWEFMTSQECIDFVKDFYIKGDIEGALPALIKESSQRWINEENLIDDTTAILIFFE